MENTVIKNNKTLSCNSIIKKLSIIALVCTVLGCFSYSFSLRRYGNELIHKYKFTFDCPNFGEIFFLLLELIPVILFVIYILKFNNKQKSTFIIPIVFSIIPFKHLFSISFFFNLRYDYFLFLPFPIKCIVLIAGILATISAIKGFNKKVFIVIAMSALFLLDAFAVLRIILDLGALFEHHNYFLFFKLLVNIIGIIASHASLLLFALKNKIPSLSPQREKVKLEKMGPEKALKYLKEKLELGTITEEEYQAQRAEIISKL